METKYLALFVILLALLLEEVLLQLVLPMLTANGAVRHNFRFQEIPVAAGLTFPVVILFSFIMIQLSAPLTKSFDIYLVAVMAMALLGFVDDMLGQRDTLGFKGHFKSLLLERQLTTGALKALGGGLVAAYAALFFSQTIWEFLVNLIVIALFTNSMNLFDLRPGRCIKVFLLIFLPLIYFAGTTYLIFLPLLGAVLVYFPYDLKAKAMMGDTGSNVLGVTLGLLTVFSYDMTAKTIVAALLILLHLFTERFSITKIIDGNRVLNYLDRLGRGGSDG